MVAKPKQQTSVYDRIYHCISLVPKGKIVTYGQVAKLISASGARQVGYALSSAPSDVKIPWHRVINAKGEISQRSNASDCDSLQQQRLLAEGVMPQANGRIKLDRYRWQPSAAELLEIQMLDDDAVLDLPGFG